MIYRHLLRGVYRDLLEEEIFRRLITSTRNVYGSFNDGGLCADLTIAGIESESGVILGEVVHALRRVSRPYHRLLLAGERRSAIPAYSVATGIPSFNISTAGVHEDMDFLWNYEHSPPHIPAVDYVVSHAMLEHLINPYNHVRDCYSLLVPGGSLILHSVIPGFQYHRFPVDCIRFFPDWFEEVAVRLNATVSARYLSNQGHIVYMLTKCPAMNIEPPQGDSEKF